METIFGYLPKDYGVKPVTLTASGIKEEGHAYARYYTSETIAWKAYSEQFNKFIKNASKIYWRMTPSVIKHKGKYQINSRIACTQKKTSSI